MQTSDQAGEKLNSVPTATELIRAKFPGHDGIFVLRNIEEFMIEFASLHVKASVKEIQERVYHDVEIDWIDPYDYSAGHNGIKGDIDRESIPDFYPLTNIK